MLGAIYIGQSGMTAYSKGLDVISNNVANLNTPGFKVTTPVFSDELTQNDDGAVRGSGGAPTDGAGVSVDTNQLSFSAGDLQSTGNPLDAAIDGNGFFVLQRNGQMLYTRAGQFEFDANGQLVDTVTQAPVMMSVGSTSPSAFNMNDYRVYPPQATTTATLTGTLSRSDSGTYSMPAFTLIDSSGGSQQVTAKFVRDSTDASKWSVEVDDANGKSIGTGNLAFNADGSPQDGQNSMTVTLAPANVTASTVTINFGAAGSFAGVTSTTGATTSQLTLQHQDGAQLGSVTTMAFDDKGELTFTYSNGLTKTPATLLLASFDDQNQLKQQDGGLFTAPNDVHPTLATAQTQGLGQVVGGQIEQSNVDLTQQFSNLIIIQRGYQASSQLTSVANEMIQQLLQMGEHP